MNFTEKLPDRSNGDSSYGKLLLLVLCVIFITMAIDKQLSAEASDSAGSVSLSDLDLKTDKGIHVARDRVREAARRLCEKVVIRSARAQQADCAHCADDAAAAVVERLQGSASGTNA